jgi:GTPase
MVLATFQIDGSFKLTGRGLVIYGDITSGTVRNENFISFQNRGQQLKLKIKSIEMMDRIEDEISKVSFLFYYENDAQKEILEILRVEKQTATITEA